jgi:hypothetical protein
VASTSPQATATSGDHHLVADLNQNGDNNVHVFHDVTAVAGDGVAGSQVIGVASSGPSTIDATNNSSFANSEGGEAKFAFTDDVNPGPKLDVTAPPITVTAIATGVATVSQTASPSFTATINQTSNPTGSSITTNTATPTITLSGAQVVTGTASLTQTPFAGSFLGSGSQSFTSPPVSIIGVTNAPITVNNINNQVVDGSSAVTNTGSVTGTSPTTQTSTQSGSSTINQTGSQVIVTSSNTGPTAPFVFTNSQNTTVITNPVVNATASGVTTSDAFTGDGVSGNFSIS